MLKSMSFIQDPYQLVWSPALMRLARRATIPELAQLELSRRVSVWLEKQRLPPLGKTPLAAVDRLRRIEKAIVRPRTSEILAICSCLPLLKARIDARVTRIRARAQLTDCTQ